MPDIRCCCRFHADASFAADTLFSFSPAGWPACRRIFASCWRHFDFDTDYITMPVFLRQPLLIAFLFLLPLAALIFAVFRRRQRYAFQLTLACCVSPPPLSLMLIRCSFFRLSRCSHFAIFASAAAAIDAAACCHHSRCCRRFSAIAAASRHAMISSITLRR